MADVDLFLEDAERAGMKLRALGTLVIASLMVGACGSSKSSDALADQRTVPQDPELVQCGQTDENANFADITRGSLVRLHSPLDDDVAPNWSPDMDYYRGQVTAVTEPLGVDAAGCPGVRVEADGGVFFWRVRDLERIETTSSNDRCGQNELTADYAGLQQGDHVVIRAHRPWYGQENWVDAMNGWVGQKATIQSLEGLDEAGCPGVILDVDDGQYFWRVRDLKPAK